MNDLKVINAKPPGAFDYTRRASQHEISWGYNHDNFKNVVCMAMDEWCNLCLRSEDFASPYMVTSTITVLIMWGEHKRHNERDGRLKSRVYRLFAQPFIQTQNKENIKAPRHWPLWGTSTDDRWIPLTKDQWRRKGFH